MFFTNNKFYYKFKNGYSTKNKYYRMLIVILSFIISVLFYSMGNFGFWNIFGIRREVQIVQMSILFPLIVLIIPKLKLLFKSPLFMLLIVIMLMSIVHQIDLSRTLDVIVALLIVGFVLFVDNRRTNKILKYIIIFCCLFSIMQIVQSFFIFLKPELIPLLDSEYSSSHAADKTEIAHPLAYLGFTSYRGGEYYIFGHEISRFRSFASEPSVLVYSFFVPGILALSYTGNIRLCAIPILFFSILLVQSGTIWVATLLGIFFWGLFHFFGRKVQLFSILPFLMVIFWVVILPKTDIYSFVMAMQNFVGIGDVTYSGLNRAGSIIHRLEPFVDVISLVKTHFLFGTSFYSDFGGSFMLWIILNTGLIGLIIAVILFSQIFKLSIHCFNKYKGTTQLMAAVLYGTILQVLLFVCNGWNRSVGFLMLALIMCRLEYLVYESDKERRMVNILG